MSEANDSAWFRRTAAERSEGALPVNEGALPACGAKRMILHGSDELPPNDEEPCGAKRHIQDGSEELPPNEGRGRYP